MWFVAIGSAAYTLLLALLFPAILRRGFTHRTINLNTVAASLSAYLLLGLIFASAYRFIQIVTPPMFAQHNVNGFTYIYFSYVTLTTVGYGDFTAANDAGRAVAVLEALFGQVFLVTIVAMVVSNLGQERRQLHRAGNGGSASRSTRRAAPRSAAEPAADPDRGDAATDRVPLMTPVAGSNVATDAGLPGPPRPRRQSLELAW